MVAAGSLAKVTADRQGSRGCSRAYGRCLGFSQTFAPSVVAMTVPWILLALQVVKNLPNFVEYVRRREDRQCSSRYTPAGDSWQEIRKECQERQLQSFFYRCVRRMCGSNRQLHFLTAICLPEARRSNPEAISTVVSGITTGLTVVCSVHCEYKVPIQPRSSINWRADLSDSRI